MTVIFYGQCPFLSCLDSDVHAHSVCPDCGAVNHGNASCLTCVLTWDCSDDMKAALAAAIEGKQS